MEYLRKIEKEILLTFSFFFFNLVDVDGNKFNPDCDELMSDGGAFGGKLGPRLGR